MSKDKKNVTGSFWSLYGKYITIVIAALVLIALIIVIAGLFSRKGRSEETQDSGSVITMAPTESSTTSPGNLMSLKLDAYPKVNALVQEYFTAKKECDATLLNNIVDYQTDKTEDELKLENEFVEDYQDIHCYTSNGLENGSYVVYVYYRIKFISIETTAPSLIRLYICTNTDGDLYIYGKAPSGELSSFIDEMDSSEDVRILIATVNKQLKMACTQDEALAKLQEMLRNGTDPSATAPLEAVTTEAPASVGSAEETDSISGDTTAAE